MEALVFQSLDKAVAQLDAGLRESLSAPENELLRDGVIQRFENTYELAWKMLKCYFEATLPNPEEVDGMSFQTLIRTGSEQGLLLSGWDEWVRYRKARGTTSRTYDEDKAREVYRIIPEFLHEARYLLDKLSEKMPRP
ncbi:MAG: nucleotidyltransferase substrate binding protein [Geobacter sp.]|nr:nucleotidyltransferase substrate binding protein [Geobacter sp.]